MNEREIMKLAESLEEFSMSDFTVEDLKKLSGKENKFKEKYFDKKHKITYPLINE